MNIYVNGEQREVPDGATVLDALRAPSTGVAIAVDGAVVPKLAWARTELTDGAVVEVLTAVQGG